MLYLIALSLIVISALCSGLTLGYFTLDKAALRRQAAAGRRAARPQHPPRTHGHRLRTTLLLTNVLVNTTLSVLLSSIASGIVATIAATSLIFIFGEIIPQAVLSRFALRFGSMFAPFVRALMWLTSPVSFPVSYILDRALGEEMPALYSHHELMELISEHEDSEHSIIDADEERIVHGALRFSHTTVREVMTPKELVTSFDIERRLTDEFFNEANQHGYSRYPVYSGNPDNIVGLLYTKDLIIEDEHIAIKDTEEAFDKNMLIVRPSAMLDDVLGQMLKKKQHLSIVKNRNGNFLGVISLEDIIEEIIQHEIEDEDDT